MSIFRIKLRVKELKPEGLKGFLKRQPTAADVLKVLGDPRVTVPLSPHKDEIWT